MGDVAKIKQPKPIVKRVQCVRDVSVQVGPRSTSTITVPQDCREIDIDTDPRGVMLVVSDGECHLLPWAHVLLVTYGIEG